MPDAAPALQPQRERIPYLDILRGLALFGILAANLPDFEGPLDVPGQPIAQAFIDIFIQGKFITLFSFLFGIGFAIQMSRAESRGIRFLSFYPRRLLSLALFGLVHGIVIWSGDILLNYAILGALLLMFRKQSQRALLYWAGGITTLEFLVLAGQQSVAPTAFYGAIADAGVFGAVTTYVPRPLLQVLHDNWDSWVIRLEGLIVTLPLLGIFLLGLWVWRTGAIEHLSNYRSVLKRMFVVCLPLGLALNALNSLLQTLYPDTRLTDWYAVPSQVVAAPILSAGYASGLALLLQHDAWKRRLMPFAAVGRMALTDYLMQSLICTAFFYFTGLYGKLAPAWDLLLAAVLYSLQVVFSNWWLTQNSYGPMEWLWRRMTYGRFPASPSPNLIP